MSRIRGKNTSAELFVRSLLHRRGFRFRLHDRKLPGVPDIVLPKFRSAIFVHGCFWHGHKCHLCKLPQTRREFWAKKIEGNRRRDRIVQARLIAANWRVIVIWECTLKGRKRLAPATLGDQIEAALVDDETSPGAIFLSA